MVSGQARLGDGNVEVFERKEDFDSPDPIVSHCRVSRDTEHTVCCAWPSRRLWTAKGSGDTRETSGLRVRNACRSIPCRTARCGRLVWCLNGRWDGASPNAGEKSELKRRFGQTTRLRRPNGILELRSSNRVESERMGGPAANCSK